MDWVVDLYEYDKDESVWAGVMPSLPSVGTTLYIKTPTEYRVLVIMSNAHIELPLRTVGRDAPEANIAWFYVVAAPPEE